MPPGVRFELYNLTGNGDLTVQTNALPLAPPFFQTSQNPGRSPELVLIFTNSALTNLAGGLVSRRAQPRNGTSISYTIVAAIETNPISRRSRRRRFRRRRGGRRWPGHGGGHGTNGTVYHVTSTGDSGPGTLARRRQCHQPHRGL